jgi:transcriptional regulator with XRE-family HTH domain
MSDDKGQEIEDAEYLKATVAFLVAEELRRSGITQRMLAQRIGVTEGRLSHVMNAEGNLTLRTLARIGTALGRRVRVRFVDERPPVSGHAEIVAVATTAVDLAPCRWCNVQRGQPCGQYRVRVGENGSRSLVLCGERSAPHPSRVRAALEARGLA